MNLPDSPRFAPVPAAALPQAHGAIEDIGVEKASILIVDDLPEKLLVLGTVLEELGHELVFVRSGREALRAVLQREFAVILLDVNMPDIDGFDTAQLIRQYRKSAHTPIIFITAYADEVQTARGYSVGAVDYILSPVVPNVLRSKVQVFVELFVMKRQIQRQADAHAAFVAAEAARHAAEENELRSAFLSHASRLLHRSLRVDVAMRELAALIVPKLASFAVLMGAPDEAAPCQMLVAADTDPNGSVSVTQPAESALGEFVRSGLQGAMRDRMRSDFTAAQLSQLDASACGLTPAVPASAPWQAAVVVPMLNGDRLLGAVFAARRGGGSPPIDWLVFGSLIARGAAALENASLYRNLQAEIVERREAEAKLLEASRRKDEFLAMLSHELRNPLAPIRTALEVIRRIAPLEPKLTWASDIMVRQVRQMTRLIDELLDVARISEGKIVLTRRNVDLNAVITQSVETVQPLLDARQQVLRVTPFSEPAWLQGDFARLAQILSNLLHNACKYSANGATIELDVQRTERGVAIHVRDEGIGIDAQLLPQVFDLFTQGQRGLERSQGGLGVGLTLARRLAEMHGGDIEAFSEGPGRGSEFTLRLPGAGLGGRADAGRRGSGAPDSDRRRQRRCGAQHRRAARTRRP
jgi:signal transduction histidine kinase/DNA-binding response OmpR family regulator